MRNERSTHLRWSAALFAACTVAPLFAGLGCSPDKGPGSLVVTYILGNSKTCADLGIDSVEASLYVGTIDEAAEPEYEERISCTDDGEIEIEGITPAIYTVLVRAYNGEEVAVLDNMGEEAVARTAEIFEAAQTSIESELTARPAQVSVRWRLGSDGFGTCDGVGIASLEFTAYQIGGTSELLTHVFSCDEPGEGDDGYRKVPDPDRLLDGDILGEVGIQPLDAAGDSTGDSATFVFEMPIGAGYPANLTIECLATGCSPAQ